MKGGRTVVKAKEDSTENLGQSLVYNQSVLNVFIMSLLICIIKNKQICTVIVRME